MGTMTGRETVMEITADAHSKFTFTGVKAVNPSGLLQQRGFFEN